MKMYFITAGFPHAVIADDLFGLVCAESFEQAADKFLDWMGETISTVVVHEVPSVRDVADGAGVIDWNDTPYKVFGDMEFKEPGAVD